MKVRIRKVETPEAISEKGGAHAQLVDKETVELETSIDEAKDALIVVGDRLLVKGNFVGLFKSMLRGIERDGHGRQLGDFLTMYPVPTGEFDLDRGWDPAVNGVRARVRLMNEMELDISKWEFEDVTPGRKAFTLESVKAGGQAGVVKVGAPVEINGKNLPLADAVRVEWAVDGTDRRGTVPAAKVAGSATRTDLAADALAELASPEYDGKTITFTERGNYANAKISAKLKYAPPEFDLTGIKSENSPEDGKVVQSDTKIALTGAGFTGVTLADLKVEKRTADGDWELETSMEPPTVHDDGHLDFVYDGVETYYINGQIRVTVTKGGVEKTIVAGLVGE